VAAGDLVYFVIPTADAERAKTFFGGLFGWEFSTGNVPGGFQIEGPSPPAGLFEGNEGSRPLPYFQVDDIEAAVTTVRELGGDAEDPQPIPSGRMAHCRDDQGLEFGLWQAAEG
jgi:predicted enzyme related to lactoylglutathione lyase